jgi:branched-chain amino acid transport system permease protein
MVPLAVRDPYFLHLLIISAIYAILVMGLNIITGFTGPLSFVHIGFYGISAYTSALLTIKRGWSFWLSWPAGIAMALVFGLVIGLLALRIVDRLLFSVVTIGFGEIIRMIIHNWEELTRGPSGLPGIPVPNSIPLPGAGVINFGSKTTYYFLVVLVALLAYGLVVRIMRSQLGIAFLAIRWNESLASAVGIHTYRIKLVAFLLSALYAGIAGGLYAHYARFLGPDLFTIEASMDLLIMLILGGVGTLLGPPFGAVVLTLLPEYLRVVADYRLVIYGAILTITVILLPQGVLGSLQAYLMRRREKAYEEPADRTAQRIAELPTQSGEKGRS